tara:strand:+ start:7002 stop:7238 length:237 start_codon:yes stop_codon:yes gene_type:complete
MILEIITPEKQLFTGEVNSIKVPGVIGDFEILNNHAPIISSLREGDIRIISIDNKVEKFQINGGVIEMKKNKIIVLAD